ncbi:putative intracellular protein transport protein [Eutypa lata UCREL1]|uniref:Putative intracellular protein transport protein n=1 Tax=Eutypa lata (strain UCR-EL1) TaxID=1287681 RepID=M7TM27_EUTLA|nr:putative intracellular protein transport protein [Eutypa lata UCREL1]
MFSSIATAPAKQSVSDTITVLSGRLSSATLLEDRRAAILGLRSFAKEYPASVSSGALRSLIGSLSNDGEDVDTVKVVLETLLMLFNPNQESPEASEEIALWLADEFTQRQENITLLLDFLETNDFYSRLYSLQLLSAIHSARTDRTEDCIVAAPLGIPRLVAILDDPREAVRNEALTLLTYLTPSSPLIQKSVAFQSAFEKLAFSHYADMPIKAEALNTCADIIRGWMFEDLDGVDDFLGEGSNINTLAETVVRHPPHSTLVRGLSSMLLGREKYVDSLSKLRSHELMRNFEVTPQKLDGSGELPEVFFDATFVDFFKDNYNRLLRAIDRDPGMEISVVTNGVQKGISREMVDSLRARLEEKEQALQEVVDEKTSLHAKLGHEQNELRKSQETYAAEIARIKSVNDALQRHHEEDVKRIESQHRAREEAHQRQLDALKKEAAKSAEAIHAEHRNKEAELQRQLDYLRKTAETEKERAQRRFEGERADLKATIARLEAAEAETARVQRRTEAEKADLQAHLSRLEVDLMKANKAGKVNKENAEALQVTLDENATKLSAAESKAKAAEEQTSELETQLTQRDDELNKTRKEIKKKEEEKAATQTELDDLLMVFGDLEEKVEKYKQRLRDLNQTISDDEDDEDEEDDDEEDDEVD